MKFAFLIMLPSHMDCDRAKINGGSAQIIGVTSLEEAAAAAKSLQAGAKAIIEATGGNLPVGFVTHLPEQDSVYAAAFGE